MAAPGGEPLSINDPQHPLHLQQISTEEELHQMTEDLHLDSDNYLQNLLIVNPGMNGAISSFRISIEAESHNLEQHPNEFKAFIMAANATITNSRAGSPFEDNTDGPFWLKSFLRWSYNPMPFFLHLAHMKYSRDGRRSAWRRALDYCFNPVYNEGGNNNQFQGLCREVARDYLRDCMAPNSRDYDNDELVHHVAHDIVPSITSEAVFRLFCEELDTVLRENVEPEGLDEDLDFMNQSMADAAAAGGFQYVFVLV